MATQAPVAAENKAPQHKEVEHLTDEERTKWLKEGSDSLPLLEELKRDQPVKKDETQASSTIPVKESADSGPARKSAEEKEAEKELNFKALRERTERLEAELEEFRTGKKKAEEKKPDPNTSAAPKLLELPKRPSMAQFKDATGALDYEKYEAALDKYETDKEAYTNQQVNLRTAEAQKEQYAKGWQAEIKTIYGKEISVENIHKIAGKLAETQRTSPAVFVQLQTSKVFPHLVKIFEGDSALLDKFITQANDPKTFPDAVRALFGMERDIEAELAKQAKEPAKKEEKPLTKAGKPPAEAAGGTSTPEDDGSPDAAWKRKDLSSAERGELYRERQNKLDREKRRKKVN